MAIIPMTVIASVDSWLLPQSEYPLAPVRMNLNPNRDDDSELGPWVFSTGLHIVTAKSRGGKSTFCASLVEGVTRDQICEAHFYYMFEEGAAGLPKPGKLREVSIGSEITEVTVPLFLEPTEFAEDLELLAAKRRILGPGSDTTPIVIVLDSISLPMRNYQLDQRAKEPAIEKSMQPSDISFCVWLSKFCRDRRIICLGVINYDLVPFANKLDAMSVGILDIGAYNRAIRHDRGTGRREEPLILPPDWVALGSEKMGYVAGSDKIGDSFHGLDY